MMADASCQTSAESQRSRVVFLVNGGLESPMGIRAASFAKRLAADFDITLVHRTGGKVAAMLDMLRQARKLEPDVCYVFDPAYSGVGAALALRVLTGTPFIVDTGDAIYELAKASGMRSPIGLLLTRLLEKAALHLSCHVVVRSSVHRDDLASRGIVATSIPDGVDIEQFTVRSDPDLRRILGLGGVLTLGLVGSLTWNERHDTCYGLELVEAMRLLPDVPVKGVIIGDGDALPRLKDLCARTGLIGRVLFLGRLPYNELPRYLNAIDICLSTQTNDAAGRVRTTGKLPLYLAAGRFILASEVGEAARVLPASMLVRFEGSHDPAYPARLAARVRELANNRTYLLNGTHNRTLACKAFDYDVLARQLGEVLYTYTNRGQRLK